MKTRSLQTLRLPGMLLALLLLLSVTGCSAFGGEKKAVTPLVMKAEDFSIFLFESSDEIYRANVKDPKMWANLKEAAERDVDYSQHSNWLYDTYAKFDEQRRAQLKQIMTDYHHQLITERLIEKGKQEAGLDEILSFMKEDRFFKNNRNTLVDFYSWYGANFALPHYQRVRPLLQRKADITAGKVEKDFDVFAFMEKETGIKLRKKPEPVELLFNMRMIGSWGYYRDKDSLSTVRWGSSPEKVWALPFHEFSHPYFRTFTGSWSFKYLIARKLKKDEQLMGRYKDDVPYTWEGWIEENLVEGFARYLSVRKGLARDVGGGIYVFDREYAQALLDGFNPQKTSLEDFTVDFLKKKYKL